MLAPAPDPLSTGWLPGVDHAPFQNGAVLVNAYLCTNWPPEEWPTMVRCVRAGNWYNKASTSMSMASYDEVASAGASAFAPYLHAARVAIGGSIGCGGSINKCKRALQ